jgi:serine/threonine protein kinase
MAGIASALSSIHNFTVTYPLSVDGPGNVRLQKDAKLSVEKSEELYGRHGDIKPENILWFQETPDTDDEAGILQIADFGLGRFHGRESRSNVHPDGVVGSPTYEPPECKLHRPVSRAYDIWSLGYLY